MQDLFQYFRQIDDRIDALEKKSWKIEKILWYIAGMISIKAGYDIFPMVSALVGG